MDALAFRRSASTVHNFSSRHPQVIPVRHNVRCAAEVSTRVSAEEIPMSPVNTILMNTVEAIFKIKPLFNLAAKKARSTIMKKAEALGIDWEGTMKELNAQDWSSRVTAVTNSSVTYPDYYTQPFHAYKEGNLCLDAALEVTMAAQSVHANVMDPAGKTMDPKGDFQMRSNYGKRQLECLSELGVPPSSIQAVVDLGCATGLSSLALMEDFPAAAVTGIDLSPHFLAVGQYNQQKRQESSGLPERLTLLHGSAESTGLPAESYDMVSMCLVAHELPEAVTVAIAREAFRILKPGGIFSIMEMNPQAPAFQRLFGNPIAFTAFKSTEPWLAEYIKVDFDKTYVEAGLNKPITKECTPKHKTVVGMKPL